MAPEAPLSSIVFYDGYCGLCDRFVSFLVREDRDHHLYFAPLQGEAARLRLPADLRPSGNEGSEVGELKTVVLLNSDGIHTRSDAALLAITRLGGVWSAARILLWIPRFIRDAVYDFVARHRYRWFGKHETCRIPSLAERARFLD